MSPNLKWKFSILLAFILITLHLNAKENAAKITNYQLFIGIAKVENEYLIILRKFVKDDHECFLVLNPGNLETKIINAQQADIFKMSLAEVQQKFPESVYFLALKDAENHAREMHDAGITHSLPSEKGIVLSVDLCPSSHPLERRIFTMLTESFNQIEKPVPIAIAISGYWMNAHKKDLEWLKSLQEKSEMNITWINHTLSHFYNKSLPLNKNFMLHKNTDIQMEVLGNEELMIENGLMPSVFFRFPGLISDFDLVDSISDFGLITIGSDAWLAKGEPVHNGSIVLIHGNGNEPLGVNKFIKLLHDKKSEEIKRSWLLFDLRESLEAAFE